MAKIGLAEPVTYNEMGIPLKFESSCSFFHPKKHIPPTNPNDYSNISPVEGKTFAACKSMQNIQWLTHTGGLNKYICKYIGKIDENNYVVVRAHAHDPGILISQKVFLHNTKITSSKMNELKAMQKKRDKNHPKGRAISLMEMLQVMLNYPQIHTDMVFENVPTLPLELRAGRECNVVKNKTAENNCNDGDEIMSLSYIIRQQKEFPVWRQHRDQELLVLQGLFNSPISVDRITKFSVRPPELRHIIRNVGNYYRWFIIKNKRLDNDMLESVLNESIYKSLFIDGLQNKVMIHLKALNEINAYIQSLNIVDDNGDPKYVMKQYFSKIQSLRTVDDQNENFISDDDSTLWNFMKHNLLYDDELKHLPIPVHSYVRPTMGPRFILHIMLSLGEFDTEYDLIAHRTLRESLRYAKLIGPLDDDESLLKYSNELMKTFILEQLIYYPNSMKVIDQWIVTAAELFESVIINNEIPITDIPPSHQTALNAVMDEKVLQKWASMDKNILCASFREMDTCVELYSIPSIQDINDCSRNEPLNWDPVRNFTKSNNQSVTSFEDQKLAIENSVFAINQYMNYTNQHTFVKCRVIAGSPGSGKLFVLNYFAIFAMSKGLKVTMTAMMAQRAIHLGGTHIHKIFLLPVQKQWNPHKVAESALQSLFQHPLNLHILKMVDVVFLDEIGQISAEMLSSMDMILRRIRSNNIFMGGLLFICTLDHKQLAPIDGSPFLVSPMILSCFEFVCLKESVRASGDPNLQRIQNIARMNPKEYQDDPGLIDEFKRLLLDTCTFVDSWNNELITPNTYRLYGKKCPAKKTAQEYVDQVKHKLSDGDFIESTAVDTQNAHLSHQEWQEANECTCKSLDYNCKEPRNLLCFVGAVYQFTYNCEGKFSQAQIGLLLDLPNTEDIGAFRKISIMVAPPGIRIVEFDCSKARDEYINEGWETKNVSVSPKRSYNVGLNMRGERRQYGLKYHVTSTVHASMGDTLTKLATEISTEKDQYCMWDKAQAIVLLSRTRYGSDIIFVGDKYSTVDALASLIQSINQWMYYQENIIELGSVNGRSNCNQMVVFDHQDYPFQLSDMPLPQCNTGFVYMLVSTRRTTFTYIGQTMNIITRLNLHNSGVGSQTTYPIYLRPFALIGYVCGFDNNRGLMRGFESIWQNRRNSARSRGVICVKQLARLASAIIQPHINGEYVQLRLIVNFRD